MSSLAQELVEITEHGAAAVLATVIEADGGATIEPGAKCLIRDGEVRAETIGNADAVEAIVRESDKHMRAEKSQLVSLAVPGSDAKLAVFFEVMPAPPKLIVVGAGHIAVPLVKIAKVLDFHVTVIDDRMLFANRDRFPDADDVLVGDMAEMLKEMTITPSCYIVLITRGHAYDEPCLRVVVHSAAKYIGMIGSRRRIKACFRDFATRKKSARKCLIASTRPSGSISPPKRPRKSRYRFWVR
jgi:xanthine dehydrogenase accessory factor